MISVKAKLKELSEVLAGEENRTAISKKLESNPKALQYFNLMYHLLTVEVKEGRLKCQK